MPRGKQIDPAVLQAALEGLEHRRAEVDQNIAAVKKMLRSGGPRAAAPAKPPAKPRRKMSGAARKRIAEAQRRRWAEFRAKSAPKKARRKRAKPASKQPSAAAE